MKRSAASSSYLNKLIKEQTRNADGSINTEANLIAHAVLGAMEAHFTGNNATASTLGALTAYAVYKLTLLETLQSLNRDVANANQKLEKQDLQALQERQGATQIVAEMGAKAN